MRRLLALILLCAALLGAQESIDYSDTPQVDQKTLYSSYASLPTSLFKGELFSITLKTLTTETHFDSISYQMEGGEGLRLLSETPQERKEGPYFYHTFSFVVTGTKVRTPNITVSLSYSVYHQGESLILQGRDIDVIALNPPEDYCGVIADFLTIERYKANPYDDTQNILWFEASLTGGDLTAFRLPSSTQQGFESNQSHADSMRFSYYALVPKSSDLIEFSFFERRSGRFQKRVVPVIVDDDSVSTQSDLKPRDHRHTELKLYGAAGAAALFLVLLLQRRKVLYLLGLLLSVAFGVWTYGPIEKVCVRAQSPIFLLPMRGGTVFEVTQEERHFEREGRTHGYIKIKLPSNQIGWIRDEDRCTP